MEAIDLARDTSRQLRLLVVDDCKDDADLIIEALRGGGLAVSARRVADPKSFRSALNSHWDLITCDDAMPGFDAVTAYRILSDSNPDIPFVIVSGHMPESRALEVMAEGACDYIDKAHLERLVPVVARELRNRHRLQSAINLDPVTGTANRSEMCRRLKELDGNEITLLLIGLDRFKKVNDVFGHAAGDRLLREVAVRLTERFGWVAVGRIGGDEFMVQTADNATEPELAGVVQRLLAEPFSMTDQEVFVTASIGSARAQPAAPPYELFSLAESALRRAKRAGRNRHRSGGTSLEEAPSAEGMALEHDLRYAVERNQLELWYQPQVSAADGMPLGCEALLRWQHPRFGMVPPGRFIPLAEETGVVVPIGRWVLETAFRAASAGHLEKVAVNISACQFHETDLVGQVRHLLEASGLAPARLELELTESTLITDTDAAVATLKAIKSLGVHVAIDDFGTGYSSLSYLKRFPLDTLKIDRSFVADLERDSRSYAITESLIGLGHRLGLIVLAEGVETAAQAEQLRQLGCDRLQGYLFGRPAPLEDSRFRCSRQERQGTEKMTETM